MNILFDYYILIFFYHNYSLILNIINLLVLNSHSTYHFIIYIFISIRIIVYIINTNNPPDLINHSLISLPSHLHLFVQGCWRKILVDDTIPCNDSDELLLPVTGRSHEIWPLLLTKALVKVASLELVLLYRAYFLLLTMIHCVMLYNTYDYIFMLDIIYKNKYTNIFE